MTRILPPLTEPIADKDFKATLNWAAYFESDAAGDTGTTWTPTFVGLTEVGTATKTGKYWRLSNSLAYFRIIITPATSTTAVLGTTYCDNFPLVIVAPGMASSISDYTAGTAGITASNKRIYTYNWSAITTPITIVGIAEVR